MMYDGFLIRRIPLSTVGLMSACRTQRQLLLSTFSKPFRWVVVSRSKSGEGFG